MLKRKILSRKGFTLIEVMVAVMIISVVIGALLQIRGSTNKKFMQIQKLSQEMQYSSFLLGRSTEYGFERSSIDMNRLVDEFELEHSLRRELKALKLHLEYETIRHIDSSDFKDESEAAQGVVFEVGRTTMKLPDSSISLLRVRVE